MAKKTIETYKGNITEFVDWISGLDDITGRNKTNNLPVSGGTIRRLLQSHLKQPIYMVSDTAAGLYRVFSSEASYNAWLDDPETFKDLELFNFVRPSDYEIKTNLDTGNRYLVSGMHDQSITKLVYDWSVENDKGTYEDSIVATYTITTASGSVTKFSQNYDTSNKHVELDIYDYLDLGQTSVRIDLLANSTGASRNYTIYITQLVLNLESDFGFYRGHDRGASMNFNWHLTRNNANTASSLYVILDGVQVDKQDIQLGSTSVSGVVQLLTDDLEASTIPPMNDTTSDGRVTHTLQLCVRTSYNLMNFDSNILYYTFEMNSTEAGIKNYFINNFFNFAAGTKIFPVSPEGLYLSATQYMPVELRWAYYTDMLASENTVQINWKLYEDGIATDLASIEATKGKEPDALTFIPATYSKEQDFSPHTSTIHLIGEYTSQDNVLRQLCNIPMYIEKSALNIVETSGYDFKLSAYGRSNSSKSKDQWVPELSKINNDDINITFHNIKWNDNSGWFENSFRTSGVDSWCEITYNPLKGTPSNGRTIEIEFESEKINDPSDVIITVGDPSGARIEISANKAALYDNSGIERIHTNYKANERVKIAFIINQEKSTTDSQLIYIVTDGILERGAEAVGYNFSSGNNGKIIIGKSASGVKFYNLRTYLRDLTYTNMYNNFIYDSENKLKLINNNAVVDSQTQLIDYSLCCRKLDTILITGDLTDILKGETGKNESETDVTIERFCPFDTTKNFKVEGAMIRKHGQSTLNYPITSMKFWLNKSTNKEKTPKFTCEGQSHLGLGKNRYIMKDNAIPANKFILQANYADSSGVHNGSILRLINDSWFAANIDGQFKLRTEPQLFSTNQTATLEDGTVMGKNDEGKNWDDCTKNPSSGMSYAFPYQIRNAPDSLPCVVFYKNTSGTNTVTFLGQYVMMDDKKSDFTYGERSIYNADPKDPFCLKVENKDNDTDDYKIWDNANVLRIEVLNINTFFTSYMNDHDENNIDFEARIPQSTGDIFRWEQDFEMIYPDPDDLEGKVEKGTDKWGVNSKFKRTAKPFVDWFRWLVSTYNDHTKFRNEAAQHLDLYKMAAYYISMLRCGLVDSGERNVQIKTYDGVHFHYEPWDMDIALGNKNTGGIAFDPPIDRNTKLSVKEWAISGRSANDEGQIVTSNWLWDALEAWPHFISDIVPTVAEALSKAGFSYNSLTNMFDNEYTAKWCEIIYNESGHYKYIDNGGSEHTYLDWLQGSRVNHRHWWLSTSMDYYDAKWTCGDFKSHFVYIAAGHTQTVSGTDIITVTPSNPTFLTLTQNDGEVATDIEVNPEGDTSGDNQERVVVAKECSRSNPATFDISTLSFSNKVPTKILGATYIEKLDVSCLASRIDLLDIKGAYSAVNGASIKEINVGNKITKDTNYNDDYHYVGNVNTTYNLRLQVSPQNDNLENLNTINIRGQLGKRGTNPSITANSLLRGGNEKTGRTQITNIYAMGANMSYFQSSKSGNTFDTLELPAKNYDGTTDQYDNPNTVSIMNNIEMNNTSWNNISFWTGTYDTVTNKMSYERYNIYGNYDYYVPTYINSITFTGSTANSANAKDFIFNWINGIIYEIRQNPDNASKTEEEIQELIDTILGEKTLILQDINWSSVTCGNNYTLSYEDLVLLSKLNHGNNAQGGSTYKGYVVLTSGNLGPIQLSKLKVLFGESAFERSGSGLIIDQERDYIEINLSGDAYINEETLEFYLKEVPDNAKTPGSGGVALLSATKFQLQEVTDTDYNWFVKSEFGSEDPSSHYNSCDIYQGADGRTYLKASESNYGNYRVNVGVTIGVETRWLVINIIGATYPDNYTLNANSTGSYVYTVNNGYIFGGPNSSAEFYITPNKPFTATIYDVQYTLTRDADSTVLINRESYKQYQQHDLNPQMLDNSDVYLTKCYNVGGTVSNPLDSPFGMTLKAISSPTTLDMYYYTLSVSIRFKSNYELITSKKVIVMDDSSIIMQSGSGKLYNLMSKVYAEANDGATLPSQVYRYHLLDMGDTVDFSQGILDPATGNNVYIENLKTSYSNQSVLRYLINVKNVIFDGLNLTNNFEAITGTNKNQMYFNNMTNLESVSLVNCSSLEYDLDFSDNLKLKSLDMRGTTINAILPENTIIENLKLGTPTSITLHGATHLAPNNIIISNSNNIDYIDIVNCGNNESFNIFGKVMNVDTNGIWVDPNAQVDPEP